MRRESTGCSTGASCSPLVQGFEQRLVAGQVRQLALSGRDVLAAHVRLEVALAQLLRTAAQVLHLAQVCTLIRIDGERQ